MCEMKMCELVKQRKCVLFGRWQVINILILSSIDDIFNFRFYYHEEKYYRKTWFLSWNITLTICKILIFDFRMIFTMNAWIVQWKKKNENEDVIILRSIKVFLKLPNSITYMYALLLYWSCFNVVPYRFEHHHHWCAYNQISIHGGIYSKLKTYNRIKVFSIKRHIGLLSAVNWMEMIEDRMMF